MGIMAPVKVKRVKDAAYAQCETCEVVITNTYFWGLPSSIWLHRNGSGSKDCKVTLWS